MAIGITENTMLVDTHKTYYVSFFTDSIYTTVTHNPAVVDNWIADVKYLNSHNITSLIVGLDVEWNPFFAAGHRNPVATLQLCVGDHCLIYQIIYSPHIPQSLIDFLSRDNIFATFVGVGIKSDLEKLQTDYGFGGGAKYVDLRVAAAEEYNRNDLLNAGLKGLARLVLGKEVEKPEHVRISRWDNRRLTAEQVKYACIDAFTSFEIGRILGADEYYHVLAFRHGRY